MNMRRLAVLSAITVISLFLASCGGPAGKPAKQLVQPLPPDVAGVWKAVGEPWQIELSMDGTVVSAVIPMTESVIRPNHVTMVEMMDGSKSTLEAGDCPVEYDPLTRELLVTIAMKAIHIRFVEERIDGSSTDTFAGRISDDGSIWSTDWMSFYDYGPRFPQDQNDVNDVYQGQLIFEKVKSQPKR